MRSSAKIVGGSHANHHAEPLGFSRGFECHRHLRQGRAALVGLSNMFDGGVVVAAERDAEGGGFNFPPVVDAGRGLSAGLEMRARLLCRDASVFRIAPDLFVDVAELALAGCGVVIDQVAD